MDDTRSTLDRALRLLGEGLRAFLVKRMNDPHDGSRVRRIAQEAGTTPEALADPAMGLRILRLHWNDVAAGLDRRARSYVHEASDVRNAWAHHAAFLAEDLERALDTIHRLLTAIGAPQAEAVGDLLERPRDRSLVQRPTRDAPINARRASVGSRSRRDLPNTAMFREELHRRLREATRQGRAFLDVNAGELHKALGGGYGRDGRLVPCCNVMHEVVKAQDEVLESSPSGLTTRLTIRYRLPR